MKPKPLYKNLTFPDGDAFEKWLQEKAAWRITFEDKGQDFLNWWIDERGEVLHSDLQSKIWNGCIVNVYNMRVGRELDFLLPEGQILKYKIEKLTPLHNEKI